MNYPSPSKTTDKAPDAARRLISELESQAEHWLSPYIERLQKGRIRPSAKVVNDAVWGSIRLHAWEVAILDSLLLQRLRGLRQLGVVHWVYPNAAHSRLEHSIGVMHQVQQLIDGLERNSGLAGEQLVDDVTTKLMRIAGLVHDCGHTVMSHVSEPLVAQLPGVEALQLWLDEIYTTRKKPSASEAFAAVFVRSPSFRELLRLPEVGADFIADVDYACETIAALLLGAPVIPNKAFLSLLINGAFDADKLDYMPRDCLMCGVPCAVDVPRLIEKVHCVEIPHGKRNDLLVNYRTWAAVSRGQPVRVLALPRAAAATLDEVAVTRTVLYEKVYFHQKVRALEAMVRRILASEQRSICEWLDLSDEKLLHLDVRLARSLAERRLLKRAFFIPPVRPEDYDRWDEERHNLVDAGWRELRRDHRNDAIGKIIADEARTVCAHLELDSSPLEETLPVVDFPPTTKLELDQYAFIGDGFADLELADEALSGQRSETAKRIARQKGYVYADERILQPVYFAAKRVLSHKYHRPLTMHAFSKTKLDPVLLDSTRERLMKCGYGGEAMGSLDYRSGVPSRRRQAMETFLRTAWPRIEKLSINFGGYQSPDGSPISEASIARFLRQFETEELARPALRMLEAVKFKARAFFAKAIETALTAALDDGDVTYVCPLGGTGDSSAMLSYFMNDLPERLRRPVTQLELALDRGPTSILLWDDFCGAGGHAITTLAQWLGRQEAFGEVLLKEQLAEELTAKRKEALRASHVSIAFALARPCGLRNLEEALVRLDLTTAQPVDPHEAVTDESGLFGEKSNIFLTPDERQRFQAFMRTKTREILRPKLTRPTDPWTDQKLDERLLGYGNTSQLVVFYYNVPTITLTALWHANDNIPWTPLFPRRGKPPLIIADVRSSAVQPHS